MLPTWTYNGSTTVTASGVLPPVWPAGDRVALSCSDPNSFQVNTGAKNPGDSYSLTVPDVGGLSGGDPFFARVFDLDGTIGIGYFDFVYGAVVPGTGFTPVLSGRDLQVWIDETDVTECCLQGAVTRRLNRPSVAAVTLPMDCAIGDVGSLLMVAFEGVLHFHGRVLLCETDTAEDGGATVYNATDPLELWQWRPVRDMDGDFSKPSIIQDNVTGPQIVEAMFDASVAAGGGPPADAEGPLRLAEGSYAGGGVDLTGAPVDWPITMAEIASLLVSTGEVDIVVTPIYRDGFDNIGQLDVYNGNYGFDLTTSVVFQYGTGLHNIRQLRWNRDMTKMVNKLWYYLGPKKDDQHWHANVVGTDPGLIYPPGGSPSPPASSTDNPVGVESAASRITYDVRMLIEIFDALGDEAIVAHDLYRRLWQIEQFLRAQPLELVHITPTRGADIGVFDIGDLVLVEAVSDVRGGFSGAQRIYEYTISWDSDSVLSLEELQVSPDNEGF